MTKCRALSSTAPVPLSRALLARHEALRIIGCVTTHCIDQPRYWRSALLPGGELLTAQFREHVFVRHWHDTYVVPIIEQGAQIYYYRGAEHTAGPGAIAVINPGEVHTARRGSEAGWAYRAFYPSAAFLHGLAAELADRSSTTVWLPGRTLIDTELSRRLLSAHKALEACGDALRAETKLIDAFALLLTRYAGLRESPANSARDRRRVRLMQAILRENLCEPVSLTQIARAAGISAHHAVQVFARETGMPPHAWRNQLRLEQAVALLRRRTPVAQVAATCGYTDQSHFTRHFRNAYGTPPGRWQMA